MFDKKPRENEMMRVIARRPNGVFPAFRRRTYFADIEPSRIEQEAADNAPAAAQIMRRKRRRK